MRSQTIEYFYLMTVQLINPTGGHERVMSASGVFDQLEGMTEKELFAEAFLRASVELGLQKAASVDGPNLNRVSILFYRCVPNAAREN